MKKHVVSAGTSILKNKFIRQARLPVGSYEISPDEIFGYFENKAMKMRSVPAKPSLDGRGVKNMTEITVTTNDMYKNTTDIGTEEMDQSDTNTPLLKIIQPNTQGIENKKEGAWYRSDTQEILDTVDVTLVSVSSQSLENYNKTGMENVKIYFGFYSGTQDPFKMYCRGWAMAAHRVFQTEIVHIKKKHGVPMLALTVTLATEKQTGTIAETGKPYTTYKPVFTIVGGKEPVIEMDSGRISFLVEAAGRFKELASTVTAHDESQNEIPARLGEPDFF